jgi:hypothetical protein
MWYGTGLQAGRQDVWFPGGAGSFSLHHCVQTRSGAHPASYTIGTRGYFPGGGGVKRPGGEADHSSPFSAEVKNVWSYTSTSPMCLHGVVLKLKHRENFTFIFIF